MHTCLAEMWHVRVQVTVLDVLGQEGALHLLPSLQKAPNVEHVAKSQGKMPVPLWETEPPAEVLRMYKQLLDEGSLNKAAELGSLAHGMARMWL